MPEFLGYNLKEESTDLRLDLVMAMSFHCCQLTKHNVAAAFGVRLWASFGEKGKEIIEWDGKREGEKQAERNMRNKTEMASHHMPCGNS